ncbi:unnamed protein product [Diplocarpon coronariae]
MDSGNGAGTSRVPRVTDWDIGRAQDPKYRILRFKHRLYPFLKSNWMCMRHVTDEEVAAGDPAISKILTGNFDLEDLQDSWTDWTTKLTEVVNITFAKVITQAFWARMEDMELKTWTTRSSARGGCSPGRPEDWCPETDEECEEGLWIMVECYHKVYEQDEMWEKLCKAIEDLCNRIGVPGTTTFSPEKNIQSIKIYMLHQAPSREREWKAKYEELRDLNKAQERIIVCLTFRYILENLPPSLGPNDSAAGRWRSFWNSAWDEAIKQYNAKTPNQGGEVHPLVELFQQSPRGQNAIRTFGADCLYSFLSADIHEWNRRVCVPTKDHFGVSFTAILLALVPASAKIRDGDRTFIDLENINWAGERQKYLRKTVKPSLVPSEDIDLAESAGLLAIEKGIV